MRRRWLKELTRRVRGRTFGIGSVLGLSWSSRTEARLNEAARFGRGGGAPAVRYEAECFGRGGGARGRGRAALGTGGLRGKELTLRVNLPKEERLAKGGGPSAAAASPSAAALPLASVCFFASEKDAARLTVRQRVLVSDRDPPGWC
mmetsp:Transcript_26715/g.53673  ORF Transcript_26715/g.53673 Transcript_26715/m.53673 type:complete len:147 (-) Transcript_26715:823-1263(-)